MLLFVIWALGFLNAVRSEDPKLLIFPSKNGLYVPAGKPFTLLCKGEAQTGAFTNIEWRNNRGETIPKGTPGVKEYGLHGLRLSFINPTAEDSGVYTCTAQYGSTKILEANTNLTFYDPIRFEDCEAEQKLVLGRQGLIRCHTNANPGPEVLWEKDGQPLQTGVLTPSGLQISSVGEQDGGLYTVEAFVQATGDAKYRTIAVSVLTNPGPITQIVFDKVTPTSIAFRLIGPANTGGQPITHYIMRYKNANNQEQATIQVEWKKDTPYIVSGLEPKAKYRFSAAARNQVGEGPWKSTEYIMPEEAVPEPPTILLREEEVSFFPDRFLLRWEVPDDNGTPITEFQVRYYEVDLGKAGWFQVGTAVEKVVRSWDSNPSYEVIGLQPDTFYRIEIRATNKIGSSLPGTVVIKTDKDYSRLLEIPVQ